MKIKLKSGQKVIDSLDSFLFEVSSLISNLNPNNLPVSLKEFYLENENIEINGIKKFRQLVKSNFYNNTLLHKEYWETRGWSESMAVEKIKEEQKKRNSSKMIQLQELKEQDYYKWRSHFNTTIEYYLEKGFSAEDAEKMRKERQTTFSKDICIRKYGLDKGQTIWQDRQKKWLSSISSNPSNDKKNSSSPSYFKKKYGEDWILKSIDKNFMCNKELVRDAVLSSNNLLEFCEYIYINKNIYSINELTTIFNSTTISEYYNVTNAELKDKLLSKYGLIPTKYGNIRYFNHHICRSNGEFSIAQKLVENQIDYIYEKKYPNSSWVSDFYIKKYDLYVEYLGFLKNDYMHEFNERICNEYEARVKTKKEFCEKNKINFIFESDYKTIINKILNYDRS